MNVPLVTHKKGFTIIETLVAIGILVTITIGATSAVQSGLSSYIFSKDQIVAFYLAQEGFEQIRNIRDTNALADEDWLDGLASDSSDPCFFGQSCTVSPVETAEAIRCAAPGNCAALRQNTTTGFFGYAAEWPASIFTREISLATVSDNEVNITVTVSWSKGGTTQQFRARENIFNWQ